MRLIAIKWVQNGGRTPCSTHVVARPVYKLSNVRLTHSDGFSSNSNISKIIEH